MAEYITKEAVQNIIYAEDIDSDFPRMDISARVHDLPAENVVPVKHGQWYWDKDGMDWGIGAWRCSACKARSPMWWNADKRSPKYRSGHSYCPVCGALMDGIEEIKESEEERDNNS